MEFQWRIFADKVPMMGVLQLFESPRKIQILRELQTVSFVINSDHCRGNQMNKTNLVLEEVKKVILLNSHRKETH